MNNKYINFEGQTVSYYEAGHPIKPKIVCLHGMGGSAVYSFKELAENLGQDFHIIAIDQPGHGRSSPFSKDADYLFSNLAEWYHKLFKELIQEPFFLLGHSWGADTALHYTKQFGSRIKGLILIDGAVTFPHYQEEMTYETALDGWKEYMKYAEYNTLEDAVNEFKNYTVNWNDTKEESLKTILVKKENFRLAVSEFTILSIIKAFFKETAPSVYPYIKSPVLLLLSTEPQELDNAREKGVHRMRRDIKDVTVVSLNGTGHMVHWDKPEKTARILRQWIVENGLQPNCYESKR